MTRLKKIGSKNRKKQGYKARKEWKRLYKEENWQKHEARKQL